jgi:type VI secretion system secreted protein Hcp
MKHIITPLLIALTCIISAATSRAAHVDYYLEIEGIPGEVSIPNHNAQMGVDYFRTASFQRALTNVAGGPASPSKAVVKPVAITKPVDLASPKLFVACVTGQRLTKATLFADYVPETGETTPAGTFLKVTLSDVVVASVDHAGDREGRPMETVTLSFSRMELSYRAVLANGTLGPETTASFNFTRNTAGQ